MQEDTKTSDDCNIIIDYLYTIKEYDIKVIVIDKNDATCMALVTADLVDRETEFWINYKKLQIVM